MSEDSHPSVTCEGLGVGLLALLVAPLSPHVDFVHLSRLQACQDGAALLPVHSCVLRLPISGDVAHHILINDSLDWVPGDHRCVFCHSISDQIGWAINLFIKIYEKEKVEKASGWSRSQMFQDRVHLGDLVP